MALSYLFLVSSRIVSIKDYTLLYRCTSLIKLYLDFTSKLPHQDKMSRSYSVTEPHPSIPKSGAYIMGGRGGAGNYKRYKAEDLTPGPNATGPASRVSLSQPFKGHTAVIAGRGGVGNIVRSQDTEERVFSFDEELVRQRQNSTPVYHIGRGGAANWAVDEDARPSTSSRQGSSGSISSDGSSTSKVRGALGKVTRKFSS